MDAQQFAARLQNTKLKNLAFFERYFPNIHATVAKRSLVNAQLNIDPNTLEVNLVENGKAIYPLAAREYNENEARQFSDTFKEGFMNHPVARATAKQFYRGRYCHGSIANYLETVQPVAEAIKPYTFKHSLPQVVFLGAGLGIHIKELLKLRKIKHAVLVEHNPDRFLASLYITDWEELVTPYIRDKSTSFVFSIGDTTALDEDMRVHQGFAGAWNHIATNVPLFPIQTVFYIHQGDPFYSKVATRLNDEIEPYTQVWGFYDDEVNQLNQISANIRNGYKVLKKIDLSSETKPAIICGNGPSIDTYMPIIKENRDKLYVIAAGSACYTLLKNDIIPDFMVSIESAYATYIALKDIPSELAKKVPLIGAAQIAPKTFDLFADGLLFLKQETALPKVLNLDKPETAIAGTPTSASNGALAIALDLKLPQLFLVGMEFGFLDKNKTHSTTSFYYDDVNGGKWQQAKIGMQNDAYKIETKEYGDVYTTPFYNTARVHAEKKLLESGHNNVINLSRGATIKHTTEYKSEQFVEYLATINTTDHSNLFQILKNNAFKISVDDINKAKKRMIIGLKKLNKRYQEILSELEPNLDSIENTVFKLNYEIMHSNDNDIMKLKMSLRGSIWHWINNYYALCKEYDAERKYEHFTAEFKKHFGAFMANIAEHFEWFLSEKDGAEKLIEIALPDAEPNIEKWFSRVK